MPWSYCGVQVKIVFGFREIACALKKNRIADFEKIKKSYSDFARCRLCVRLLPLRLLRLLRLPGVDDFGPHKSTELGFNSSYKFLHTVLRQFRHFFLGKFVQWAKCMKIRKIRPLLATAGANFPRELNFYRISYSIFGALKKDEFRFGFSADILKKTYSFFVSHFQETY